MAGILAPRIIRAMKQALGGAVLGLGAMILLMVIAVMAAGGGHGTYLLAKVFFPFSMLAAMRSGQIGFDPLALAVLQCAGYGAVIGATSKRRLATAFIVSVHVAATVAAIMTDTESF